MDWNFSRASIEDLYSRIPTSVKLILVIVEKRDDFTGRQVIEFWFSSIDLIRIFRLCLTFRNITNN
jgi:hypothetical protein